MAIASGTRIGHVHLKVADLQRALDFYCGVLGFELMQRMGDSAAFISAGGYHHHIGLNTWESAGGSPPPRGSTGLYHLAILYPTRADLGDALRRVVQAGIPLDGAADHGVSEALYLRDPDDNGVELYRDLGFELMAQLGQSAAFLAAGGYHHHLGANSWESAGAEPAGEGVATLERVTILVPGLEEERTLRDPSGNPLALVPA